MSAGRTVRATLPGADEQSPALRAIPGVESVEVRGDTVLVHSRDTDAVARHLLTSTGARDLEITPRGLEDAFIALTGDDTVAEGGPTMTLLDLGARRVPPLGGFNPTLLRLELRRLLRNRRTMIFTVVMPVGVLPDLRPERPVRHPERPATATCRRSS